METTIRGIRKGKVNNSRGRVRSGVSDGVMAILRNVNVNGRTWSDVVGDCRSRTRVDMVYDSISPLGSNP